MAMTTKPAPCEAPVSFCEGALKFLMSCWNGAYMMATRIWPPMPIAIPTRSMSLKRTPRSRKKWRVPWVRLASHGAPMKPIHRPIRVVTTYHSGRDRGRGDDRHLRRRLPGDGAGDVAEDQRADLADQEADHGVEQPHPALALRLRGDPRGIEEGEIALGHHRGRGRQLGERRVVLQRGRGGRCDRNPGQAAGCGGPERRGGRDRASRRGRRGYDHGRTGGRLLEPFAGHVSVRNGSGGPCGRTRWSGSRPAGLGIGHRQDVTGARRGRHLQGDPRVGKEWVSDRAVTTDQGRRLAWQG